MLNVQYVFEHLFFPCSINFFFLSLDTARKRIVVQV